MFPDREEPGDDRASRVEEGLAPDALGGRFLAVGVFASNADDVASPTARCASVGLGAAGAWVGSAGAGGAADCRLVDEGSGAREGSPTAPSGGGGAARARLGGAAPPGGWGLGEAGSLLLPWEED